MLDQDTINADNYTQSMPLILCRKPHIGPEVFDLVHADTDCLQNPLLCHVMDQPILPPFVARATSDEQLAQQCAKLRQRGQALLQQAEQNGDEERAEIIRTRILAGIARTTEHYVAQFADTKDVEEELKRWIFNTHWDTHPFCLTEASRNSLVSGEYIWKAFKKIDLPDWAAPAVQYCRTLESELKRRFYTPCKDQYSMKREFTLGTIPYIYQNRHHKEQYNWNQLCQRVKDSGGTVAEFATIAQRLCNEEISQKRNKLAHGENIDQQLASELHESIIGDGENHGILRWIVKNIATY
jgi:hypothetical protein